MKKIYGLLVILLIMCVGLAVVVRQTQQQLQQQATELMDLRQSSARLNDFMVALQRAQVADMPSQSASNAASASAATSAQTTPVTPTKNNRKTAAPDPLISKQSVQNSKALLQSQLQLVEFAITQQQYVYALEQLKTTRQILQQQPLAAPLKNSLLQSLIADEKNILQQLARFQQQQTLLLSALSKVDQQLQQQAQLAPTSALPKQAWWQHWLQIQPAQTATPALMYRQNQYQMVQWRLQLAQQALMHGQSSLYVQQLNWSLALLKPLPDAASLALSKRIQQLQDQPLLSEPPLQTLALLR